MADPAISYTRQPVPPAHARRRQRAPVKAPGCPTAARPTSTTTAKTPGPDLHSLRRSASRNLHHRSPARLAGSRSGFHHPGLGDRRFFVEVQSPQGVMVLLGDPNCIRRPSMKTRWLGGKASSPTRPAACSSISSAQARTWPPQYLKNVAPQRFGPIQTGAEADRKDIAETNKKWHPDLAGFKATVHQVAIRAANRSGRLLAFSFSTGGIWESAATGRATSCFGWRRRASKISASKSP